MWLLSCLFLFVHLQHLVWSPAFIRIRQCNSLNMAQFIIHCSHYAACFIMWNYKKTVGITSHNSGFNRHFWYCHLDQLDWKKAHRHLITYVFSCTQHHAHDIIFPKVLTKKSNTFLSSRFLKSDSFYPQYLAQLSSQLTEVVKLNTGHSWALKHQHCTHWKEIWGFGHVTTKSRSVSTRKGG